jgi:hypothetical protein
LWLEGVGLEQTDKGKRSQQPQTKVPSQVEITGPERIS